MHVDYTSIDLNATGTTEVHNPTTDSHVVGVWLENSGSTAVVQLEVTDGTSTAVLTPAQTAGDGIDFSADIALDADDTLQINVTTAEGSALTGTAAASRSNFS